MSFGKIILGFIIAFTILTVISFFVLEKKYSISLGIVDSSIIIFAFLVWLNDKYHHERMSQRIFSIEDKRFIQDVIIRQLNMHGITDIKDYGTRMEFYKKGHKAGELKFRTDENGDIVQIDGKYVIEIEAPEYILHNIDHETWSLIGKR